MQKTSRHLFGTVMLINLAVKAPIFVISGLLGAEAAALYEAASRFAGLLALVPWSVGFVVAPLISGAHAAGNRAQVQAILVAGCWLSFGAASLCALVLVLFGEPLLLLVAGADYVAAYAPMLFLAAAYVVNAASGPTNHVFMMTGHARYTMWISVVELMVTALALVVLSAWYGLVGACAAVLLGLLWRNVLLNVILSWRLGYYSAVWSRLGWRHMVRIICERKI